MGSSQHSRLYQFQQLQRNRRPQQVVLLSIDRTLNLLPSWGVRTTAELLQPGESSQPLPCMLHKPQPHLLRQHMPTRHKRRGVLLVPRPELLVHNSRQHVTQLRKPPCRRQFRDCLAKLAPWRTFCGHLHQLAFQPTHIDSHLRTPRSNQIPNRKSLSKSLGRDPTILPHPPTRPFLPRTGTGTRQPIHPLRDSAPNPSRFKPSSSFLEFFPKPSLPVDDQAFRTP